jgi:LPS sulfotransferase NodH
MEDDMNGDRALSEPFPTLDKQYILIIGAPRSGTTWLQSMLGAHPRVSTTVELTLFSQYTASWFAIWAREAQNLRAGRWYQGLPFLWTEEEFHLFLREFIERVYQRVSERNLEATHVVDKHPGYSKYVKDINKLLPKARFIHVIRDGRDVAVSMVAARKHVGFGAGTIQDAALAWKSHVAAARRASNFRGRYLEVRYESMLTDGIDTLQAVFDFCGLRADRAQVTAIVEQHQFVRMKAKRQVGDSRARASKGHYRKGKAGGWKLELSPIDRYICHRMAGTLLHELGYSGADWWATSAVQKVFLPPMGTAAIVGREACRRIYRASAQLLGPRLAQRFRDRWLRRDER